MKLRYFSIIMLVILFSVFENNFAQMKKVGQSGMTYLAISLGARESGMGSASVASVKGVQSIFYNPGALTTVENFGVVINHVGWLADTQLYGVGDHQFTQHGIINVFYRLARQHRVSTVGVYFFGPFFTDQLNRPV